MLGRNNTDNLDNMIGKDPVLRVADAGDPAPLREIWLACLMQ